MTRARGRPSPSQGVLDRILERPAFALRAQEVRDVRAYLGRPQDVPVSIVVPTWNRAAVLGRALDSLCAQRYENFEVLVADDGSTDDTEALVKRYCRDDPRFRYLRLPHAGVSRARNAALARATGQVIAYLDSDNRWSPNYLLVMIHRLVDAPGADAAYCGIHVVDGIRDKEYVRLPEYDRAVLRDHGLIDLNVFVHRRSLYERLGGFDEALEPLEDWDLTLRYTRHAPPLLVACVLATYYRAPTLGNASAGPRLPASVRRIRAKYRDEGESAVTGVQI